MWARLKQLNSTFAKTKEQKKKLDKKKKVYFPWVVFF